MTVASLEPGSAFYDSREVKKKPTKAPYPVDKVIDDYQRRLASIPTWTEAKRNLVYELWSALAEARFGFFHTNVANCFRLSGLGNDVIKTIPANKRGHLRCWRGKTVRIICIGPGRYKRTYAAGPTEREADPEPDVYD